MKLIETKTLASNASSIEFINIPQTFTDLVLWVSLRHTVAQRRAGCDVLFNGSTANFTSRIIEADHAAVYNGAPAAFYMTFPAANATSNSFGVGQIYIPNYAGSTQKSFGHESTMVTTDNVEQSRILWAGRWSQTAAITSIGFSTSSFAAGSTISLYGILKGSSGGVVVS